MYQTVVYSKNESYNKQLSRNFQVYEFACNDGSDVVVIDPLLVWILQNVRDYFGMPVHITSAYRTVSYNADIGGASGSMHTFGMAADFVVDGVEAHKVQSYLETVMPGTGGIGKSEDYTHVDTRAEMSRWTY